MELTIKRQKKVKNKDDLTVIRMLLLIKILKDTYKIKSYAQFCREIGIAPQTLTNVQMGKHGFTAKEIGIVVKKYNVNANWIFGVDNDNIFRVSS